MISRTWLCALALAGAAQAHAAVTLVEANDWKIQMSGFVELDAIHDSTRGLPEVIGSTALPRPGTANADNGETQFSIRNSRLAFSVLPPVQDDWKTKGYLEFDLLGYDPKPASSGTTNSEGSFYTNPTFRVRHAYFNAEKNGWTLLAGQTWTVFGWQPTYVLSTASVPPVTGAAYQRTPQISLFKDIGMGEKTKMQTALSIARPSQRDAERPNLEAGLKLSSSALSSGFAAPNGDVGLQPMSVAVSGTFRQFITPKDTTVTSRQDTHDGAALAIDAMLPVIPGDSPAGTLTLTGEYTTGKGYADAFPSWTAGLSQMPGGTGVASATNMDAGQGGFDADGTFHLLQMQSWNAQLQYHLPGDLHTFVTVGYGELKAFKVTEITNPSPSASYDVASTWFANVFHDFTKQVRGAAEYARFNMHYTDAVNAKDDRVSLVGYFRF